MRPAQRAGDGAQDATADPVGGHIKLRSASTAAAIGGVAAALAPIRLGAHTDQQAPLQAYDQGKGQHGYAGYSSQVAAARQTLVEIQFGHDITPGGWRLELCAL